MAAVGSILPIVGKSLGEVFAYFFIKTSTGTCEILINIIQKSITITSRVITLLYKMQFYTFGYEVFNSIVHVFAKYNLFI